ncbi:maleylpyruvate isomerase family mycothiol-dependent enzyme [Hoyosella altamirensis]|uniref:Uncharacterized protein (TIGR03083 family) n=1 Tax=Hoyosella altamirensis TaxID=616997 RepID=A0A839RKF1_9ACTN|nr:maleylpyruvate isomerase family mycothiol-dependent enzyme [Hoyosella altamirensis]MBB3036553.1 uncharacterized protein (TIGR03083 family) [Hoyosella altamirensis]
MDHEARWYAIEQERLHLADMLESLTPNEWDAPSLCEGWLVRDVAAHVALGANPPLRAAAREAIRNYGRFNKMNQALGIAYGSHPEDQIVAALRKHAASRKLPPLTNQRNILADTLIHAQDIALPLSRDHHMPVELARDSADRLWEMIWPMWAKRRYRGVRFTATDTDWTAGRGSDVHGPISALLMVLGGRRATLSHLSGDGLPDLTRRV